MQFSRRELSRQKAGKTETTSSSRIFIDAPERGATWAEGGELLRSNTPSQQHLQNHEHLFQLMIPP